jgi:hypothetical protein
MRGCDVNERHKRIAAKTSAVVPAAPTTALRQPRLPSGKENVAAGAAAAGNKPVWHPERVRATGMMILIRVRSMASASVIAAARVSMLTSVRTSHGPARAPGIGHGASFAEAYEPCLRSATACSCARGHQPLRLSNTRMQPSGATKDGVTGLPASIASTTLPTYC